MPTSSDAVVKLIPSLAAVDAAQWDLCANPDPATFNPFVSHAFLKALEDSRTVGRQSGWLPRHLVLEDEAGNVTAAAPAYVKSHSQGEYVFDHGWAEAYTEAGGRYYPKLQISIPFTPVPGPRLLVKPGPRAFSYEQLLATAAIEVARQGGLSSVHLTFLSSDTAAHLRALGFLTRTGQQFHWQNREYASFDDFLATLASRKRKAIRKERESAIAPGIDIERVTAGEITEAHWDAMFAFYMDTGNRKWGRPYLNRAFFSELGKAMPERCLLVLAKRAGRYIAGALNFIGGDCLYGRYWGAIEHHPALHFEVCYYQAIDFAIRSGLARVEAGAQGEHKLARGYLPVETYSAHWIADPSLRRAVERFLRQERDMVTRYAADLTELGPYRKDEM
jgi:predicted N-acyltransferase